MTTSRLGACLSGPVSALFAVAVMAGCQGPPDELANELADEPAREPARPAGGALLAANGLTINGLTLNGLTMNGLTLNGLTMNGLTADRLAPATLSALRDRTTTGDVTRIFFRYLVSCALPAGHNVTYTWIDGAGAARTETAAGAFSLAPAWESGTVDLAGQEWVSACLFARTNSLGLSVPISIRGDGSPALTATSQERVDYPYGEGAFWGNLFASTPYGRSCSRAPFGVGAPSSPDLKNGRTCASQDCGVIDYIGPCFTSSSATSGQACFRRAGNNDWVSDCSYYMTTAQATNPHVITTWLRP